MLELLRIRNFLYTHAGKIRYEPKFTLEELRAAMVRVGGYAVIPPQQGAMP